MSLKCLRVNPCWFSSLVAYRRHLNALTDLSVVGTHLGGHAFKPVVMGTSQACAKPDGSGKGQVSNLDESGVFPRTISLALDLRSEQE